MNKIVKFISPLVFFTGMVGPLHASMITFQDNFDTVTGTGDAVTGGSLLNWDGGGNWSATLGTVDLVSNTNPWGVECLNNQGYCVDLDGSTNIMQQNLYP